MVAQDEVDQVFLFAAGVRGDVPKQQVLAQVLDFQTDQLRPLEGRLLQQLAGAAPAEAVLQDGAHGAEVLLALAAHVLEEEEGRRGMGERSHTHLAAQKEKKTRNILFDTGRP